MPVSTTALARRPGRRPARWLAAAAALGLALLASQPAAAGPRQGTLAYRRVALWSSTALPPAPGTFRAPEGLDLGPDGRVYVADAALGQVHVLAADGRPLALWGGDLGEPSDVAAGAGALYVTDPPGNRVLVLGPGGAIAAIWPLPGGPSAIDLAGDRLLVLLREPPAVVVLGLDGVERGRWGGAGNPFGRPRGLAVAPDGGVYVADYGAKRVWAFDAAGLLLGGLTLSQEGVTVPAVDVAVDANGEVYALSESYWYRFREGQALAGPFEDPGGRGIAIGPGPGLLTTVQDDRRGLTGLRHFADRRMAIQSVTDWGNPFTDLGILDHPRRVSANADGQVFLLDDWPRIQTWSASGQALAQFGAESPWDLAAGLRGSVYGLSGRELGYWTADGQALWTWRPAATQPLPGQPLRGWLTAVDSQGGDLAVLDLADQRVHLLDFSANPLASWPVAGPEAFASVADLALTPRRVYLLNRSARRVEARDRDGGATLASFEVPGSPIRLDGGEDDGVTVLTREGWLWRKAADGTTEALWSVAEEGQASDLASGPGGRVYVSFEDRDSVGVYEPDPAATPPPAPSFPDQCALDHDKTAEPAELRLGETVTVRLAIDGTCPLADARADILLLVDTSGSMSGAKMAAARAAALAFVGQLDYSLNQIGLVSFSTEAALVQPLTGDPRALIRAIPNLGDDGATSMNAALRLADAELGGPRARPGVRQVVVLLTDGQPTDGADGVIAQADQFRQRGRELYTIGLGLDVARAFLRGLATLPNYYFEAPSPYDLNRIYDTIARRVSASQLLSRVTVTDRLPANMRFEPGSDRPPARYEAAAHRLVWTLSNVSPGGLALSYRLRPQAPGRWPTNVEATADYVDGVQHAGQLRFPVPEVLVRAAERWSAWLPILYREQCPEARVDVVLAFDTSSSMLEPAPGGGSKLDAAITAGRVFVGQLRLGRDRVAVVAFNAGATRVLGLSEDPAAVAGALGRLPAGSGTRLDLGLDAARAALGGGGDGRLRVVVLLSDGRQSGAPEQAAVEAAATTRAAGIDVYTVGLGADADRALLTALTGSPERAYHAPGEADLARIYRDIARAIPCR